MVFELWHHPKGGAGRSGSVTGPDPESADLGRRLLGLSFSIHVNKNCILRMGGGEGGGAPGHSLSPNPPPPQRPHWPRIDHACGCELMQGAPAARGTRIGIRGGRTGFRGVSPVARAAPSVSAASQALPPPASTCNALRVALATTPGAVEGQQSKLVGPQFWARMLRRTPASATSALPAHAEHPSSTWMKSLHGNQAIRPNTLPLPLHVARLCPTPRPPWAYPPRSAGPGT